ncbi:hypothetical protein PS020_24420, partial [Shigella sonnei]|nr:hypothetical protein [Shigella sonnei]
KLTPGMELWVFSVPIAPYPESVFKNCLKKCTSIVHFFKQFLKTDSGYGAMGIFCTHSFIPGVSF